MHALPFALKRAHFASLKLLREFTLPHDLTPARFDLLYALHISKRRCPFQWWLAKRLGVTRATICKMIKAMRALGLIELSAFKTQRQRRISLTRDGRKKFGRALKAVRRRKVDAAVRNAWRTMNQSRSEQWATVGELFEGVNRYSRGLNEFTELYRYLTSARRARA